MEVIVLHNVNDKHSRDFVDSLPQDNEYIVIDWYNVHCLEDSTCTCFKGNPYPGSPPSAFPELVFYDANPPNLYITNPLTSEVIEVPIAPAWVNIRAAESVEDLSNRNKYGVRK